MKVRYHQSLTEHWNVQDRLAVGWSPSGNTDRQLSELAAQRYSLRQALAEHQSGGRKGSRRRSARLAGSSVVEPA